jgi:hypothetical protein
MSMTESSSIFNQGLLWHQSDLFFITGHFQVIFNILVALAFDAPSQAIIPKSASIVCFILVPR